MPVSPQRPKGPPLNSLRAFEAAARLGGFAAAADELNVTPGAISQHIRSIEDWAGVPLFERRSQGVRLTAEGARLLPRFTDAFDALGMAVRDLRSLAPETTLTIAALPSVAQLWLQPRLGAFRAALPDVTFSITATETPPNLSREFFDLSLFMRPADASDTALILTHDSLTPVCAPDLAGTNLNQHPLLHDETWGQDWPIWAAATDADLPRPNHGPRYSLYSMAVEDAKAGAGILMGHTALLEKEIAAGTLIAPFGTAIPTPHALVAEIAPGPFAAPLRAVLLGLSA